MGKLKYNLNAIYLSLYSKIFYWDLIRNRSTIGVSYIALITVLGSFVYIFSVGLIIKDVKLKLEEQYLNINDSGEIVSFKPAMQSVIAEFPRFSVEKGQVTFDITEPKVIDSNPSFPSLVFDPTSRFNVQKVKNVILLNNNNFILKIGDNQQELPIKDLEKIKFFEQYKTSDGYIDNQKLIINISNFVYSKLYLVYPLIFLSALFAMASTFIFSTLLFSALGILLAAQMGIKGLPYKKLFALAAYTQTAIFILEAVKLVTMSQIFGMQFLVYFILHLLYMFYALDAFKDIEISKAKS